MSEGNERSPLPTPAELEVLRVLWTLGPTTVKGVHQELEKRRRVGLTSVLKTMQVMEGKETIARVGSARPQVFCATQTQSAVESALTVDLVTRAFAGSTADLIRRAIDVGGLDEDELREVEQMIEKARKKRGRS